MIPVLNLSYIRKYLYFLLTIVSDLKSMYICYLHSWFDWFRQQSRHLTKQLLCCALEDLGKILLLVSILHAFTLLTIK